MSKMTNRDAAPGHGRSVDRRLARGLDAADLARVAPHLPPETLHQLIRVRGLEACRELVTSATPAQLASLLDLDLWRHERPGRDEQFDVDRFGEWLEVLVDAGRARAARTVAALDKDLMIAGLSRYVRVFDPGIFEPTAQSDDEAIDRHEAMREGDAIHIGDASDGGWKSGDEPPMHDAGGDGLECEVAGYIVRARRADAWDAIVTLLAALDADHADYCQAVMRGCRRLSNSRPEIDGLDDLLRAPEQQLHDVAIERERRRSRQGYATPADARAFLEMARRPTHTHSAPPSGAGAITANPIATAYFRAAELDDGPRGHRPEEPPARARTAPFEGRRPAALQAGDVHAQATERPESLEAVMERLIGAGVMPEPPRARLAAAEEDPQAARLTRLRRLMACVRDRDETAYLTRNRELAFLANTLLAGCSVQSRPFTAREASDAAAAICNLGLEYWPARWPGATAPAGSSSRPHGPPSDPCQTSTDWSVLADRMPSGSADHRDRAKAEATGARPSDTPPDAWLIDHDLVTAFEVGWSVLYQDVSLFVGEQLISMLTDLHAIDQDIRRELAALRRALVTQCGAGTPWRAREAADVLATLDMTAWSSLLGLLDECPVIPAALAAVLEGRTTSVSATAFSFIATAAQIGDIRLFMRKLPALLSR